MKSLGSLGAVAALLAGCAVSGGGVGVGAGLDAGAGYEAGYYEPYGYEYGGWGAGYGVAPWRADRGHHEEHRRDEPSRDEHPHERGHAPIYRPAPPGRSMPSLPAHPRSH